MYGIHGEYDGDTHGFGIESKYKLSVQELQKILVSLLTSKEEDSSLEIYDWRPIRLTPPKTLKSVT